MEQEIETDLETPRIRYAFPMPRRRKRCESRGCQAYAAVQVRVGTARHVGTIELLCRTHYLALLTEEQGAALPVL